MSIALPEDAEARAMTFKRLSDPTKKQLLDTLKSKPAEDQSRILNSILSQGGAASEFFHHVLGKETNTRVRDNKRVNPIHTK